MFDEAIIDDYVASVKSNDTLVDAYWIKLFKKIKIHNSLYITLNDLNVILKVLNKSKNYNIDNLKKLLQTNGISYKTLNKITKIPKATISKMLNGNRNVKLSTLNKLFTIINENTDLMISKEDLI